MLQMKAIFLKININLENSWSYIILVFHIKILGEKDNRIERRYSLPENNPHVAKVDKMKDEWRLYPYIHTNQKKKKAKKKSKNTYI